MDITYKIILHEAVVKDDISRLDTVVRERIRNAIRSKLTTDPELYGKPLRKGLKGYRKLRVGDYRIIFRISKREVRIVAIFHRSYGYEWLEKRGGVSL